MDRARLTVPVASGAFATLSNSCAKCSLRFQKGWLGGGASRVASLNQNPCRARIVAAKGLVYVGPLPGGGLLGDEERSVLRVYWEPSRSSSR